MSFRHWQSLFDEILRLCYIGMQLVMIGRYLFGLLRTPSISLIPSRNEYELLSKPRRRTTNKSVPITTFDCPPVAIAPPRGNFS